jgi:hypothetical protein
MFVYDGETTVVRDVTGFPEEWTASIFRVEEKTKEATVKKKAESSSIPKIEAIRSLKNRQTSTRIRDFTSQMKTFIASAVNT